MKRHAMPVLRIGQDAPAAQHHWGDEGLRIQISLNATAMAKAVIPRLTHGPQSMAPAMIVIAKSGKNDLPRTSLALDRNACDRRFMLRSFTLRFSCSLCL